ncbi:hypothetical protein AG1IA_08970 [Rhizoctonia solani AG-1 IA]|uniref:Heat shock 70 kDa protein 12A n=1 Tax=Thanatephorus cucumeris (strain AG1-IA) TaxID=983506 RepID=L8WJT5_THACA|nr:hypothetical protein AG1IA_08970 [Rhizoctonia solani AG-1 IA]
MNHKALKLRGPMIPPVADGAVIWNIVNSVSSRAPRYSFGVICARVPHAALEGSERRRGVALDAEAVCRETYTSVHDKSRPDLSNLSMDIYCYSADDEPVWAWDENDDILPDFRKSCTISADLRGLEGALERRRGRRGNFWSLKIDVCMRFGGTELEAYIEWKDKVSGENTKSRSRKLKKVFVQIWMGATLIVARDVWLFLCHPSSSVLIVCREHYSLTSTQNMSNPRGAIDPIPKLFQGTWEGENKIVVGIDIGTTQSGVAFAFLEKGQDQAIQRVTHWPGQEAQSLASKIPTLVWYNTDKEAVSFGAEALSPQAEEEAEDNEWQLARHFKLHLHPGSMRNEHGLALDPLPPGISLLRVYSDFLGYLIRHTQTFFEDRIIDGRLIWQKHRPSMQFIIAHPNGWGIREQAFLRTAATNAGLVTNATAATCIRFVTEAEASVHFCIYHTNLGSRLKPGMKFAVCDAGGSTVDTTVYSVISTRVPIDVALNPFTSGVQAGAIFVNAAAEQHIQRTLTSANLPSEDVADYSKRGIQDFEKNLKRQFAGSADSKTVEVAGTRTNYPAIGIRRGHMSLSGYAERVQKFFDICVNEIKSSVDQQIQGPYLRRVFKDRYEPQGCQITLTNDSTSKAVADGAIIWSTTSNVTGRAPRSSFGIETSMRYNSGNVDHQGREVITCPSGNQKVSGIWSQIAGVTIDARAVARESFSQAFSSPNPDLSNFEVSLISYANNGEPMWARDKRGKGYIIRASGALEPRIGVHGNKYWRLYFEVCIRFGGTELEAYLEWEERGATRTSDVTIVPDDPVEEFPATISWISAVYHQVATRKNQISGDMHKKNY